MKKDIYTIEYDFSNEITAFNKAQLKQVIYTDDRLFQSIILEYKNYKLMDVRELVKEIKKDHFLMDLLSTVQPFSIYGFTGNKIALTFKQGCVFREKQAKELINYILDIAIKDIYRTFVTAKR